MKTNDGNRERETRILPSIISYDVFHVLTPACDQLTADEKTNKERTNLKKKNEDIESVAALLKA